VGSDRLHLFPVVIAGNPPPTDGILQDAPKFCRTADHSKCREFYSKVRNIPGFHQCPYGFSSYVSSDSGQQIIYTGIRVTGYYDKDRLASRADADALPKQSPELVQRAIGKTAASLASAAQLVQEAKRGSKETDERREFINFTIHEIRRLNAQIKAQVESMVKLYGSPSPSSWGEVEERVHNIQATSSLISIRLNVYDINENPQLMISRHAPVPLGVYSKFKKAAHVLDVEVNRKSLRLRLEGTSYKGISAHEIFDLLPFVLFENAIKYSPSDQQIVVRFQEGTTLEVTVCSIGPMLKAGEESKVFERGYRGEFARGYTAGTGAGLHLAKTICDLHDIRIRVESDPVEVLVIDGIPMSEFRVILEF
jgi:hypothetical protein